MPFYYLTANKKRDVCHNSGPLASLRLKNTSGGELTSVDLLKITLLQKFFLYFYKETIGPKRQNTSQIRLQRNRQIRIQRY